MASESGEHARVYSLDDVRDGRRRTEPRDRCAATTVDGRPCRNYATSDGYCSVHAAQAGADGVEEPVRPPGGIELVEALQAALGERWSEDAAELVAFARKRLSGDYSVDVFGFDPELTEAVLLPLLRPLYRRYWRVRSIGHDRIPAGGCLVVGNHAGTIPADALMVKLGLYDETGRHLRLLGADLVWRMPVVAEIARKMGSTMARDEDATRLLEADEMVGVWPEGFKGIGKRYRDRYKLQRFGRGGFVSAAMRTGVPIVPLSVVGAEEIYPLVGNVPSLARLLGVPYIPITPLFPWLGPLGMVPLPSKASRQ
jgi:1-acyl-sn-glycerol-3-phosphate acyltransferase